MTSELEEVDLVEQDAHLLALQDLECGELHPEEIVQREEQEAALAEARKKAEEAALQTLWDDLPDQRITDTTQQEKYAVERGHRAALKKLAEEAAQRAWQQYIRENPEAAHLACITTTAVKQAKPKNQVDLRRYIEQVIGCLLWQSDECPTMASVLAFVNRDFPHAPQSANFWAMKLQPFQRNRIAVFIQGNRPNWNVQLAGCKTLRDCRNAILLAKAKQDKSVSCKASIVVTADKLYIGDKVHSITTSEGYGYKRVRVEVQGKRQWIRLDAFLTLFGISE